MSRLAVLGVGRRRSDNGTTDMPWRPASSGRGTTWRRHCSGNRARLGQVARGNSAATKAAGGGRRGREVYPVAPPAGLAASPEQFLLGRGVEELREAVAQFDKVEPTLNE